MKKTGCRNPLSRLFASSLYLFIFRMNALFDLRESLRDLTMTDIKNALPEGTFTRSQKCSRAEMGAVPQWCMECPKKAVRL